MIDLSLPLFIPIIICLRMWWIVLVYLLFKPCSRKRFELDVKQVIRIGNLHSIVDVVSSDLNLLASYSISFASVTVL